MSTKKLSVACIIDDNKAGSNSGTAQYIIADEESKHCAIIDPVYDFDVKSASFSTLNIEKILSFVKQNNYIVDWILETHAHADHVTGAQVLKKMLLKDTQSNPKVAIGQGIVTVQKNFAKIYNLAPDFPTDGSQFDHLFKHNESFKIGDHEVQALATPGHTPDSITYYFKNDCVFVGDTVFMPDSGTARCDFPNGSAEALYDSIVNVIYQLPDDTRVFCCHDYAPGGRPLHSETTIKEQKEKNKHVVYGVTTKEEFVKIRKERDATLSVPALIIPAVQLNIAAGHLPAPENNSVSYIKYPLNVLNSLSTFPL